MVRLPVASVNRYEHALAQDLLLEVLAVIKSRVDQHDTEPGCSQMQQLLKEVVNVDKTGLEALFMQIQAIAGSNRQHQPGFHANRTNNLEILEFYKQLFETKIEYNSLLSLQGYLSPEPKANPPILSKTGE